MNAIELAIVRLHGILHMHCTCMCTGVIMQWSSYRMMTKFFCKCVYMNMHVYCVSMANLQYSSRHK